MNLQISFGAWAGIAVAKQRHEAKTAHQRLRILTRRTLVVGAVAEENALLHRCIDAWAQICIEKARGDSAQRMLEGDQKIRRRALRNVRALAVALAWDAELPKCYRL